MEPTDTNAITEFAIVVAGFSGLVVAVVQREGQIRPLDKYRTVTMLTYAFSAAFGSLLPILATAFTASEPQVWWYSGLGLMLLLIGNVAATAISTLMLSTEDLRQLKKWMWGLAVGGNSVLIAWLGFSLVQAPQWIQGAFMSGLIWQLLLASILFTRLITQIRSGSAND
jgi:hypothetical protein